MSEFFRLIRLPNLCIIALTQLGVRYGLMSPLLHKADAQLTKLGYENLRVGLLMNGFDFFLLVLSTVFIAAAGYIINDYFDTKTDRLNRPERVVVGRTIKRRVAIILHFGFNLLGLLIAIWLAYKAGSWKIAGFQVFSILALWFYSTQLKGQMLAGNILIAFLAALVPITVGVYEFSNGAIGYIHAMNMVVENSGGKLLKYISLLVIGYSLFAFMSNLIREIIKDMEDYDGDIEDGRKTLPIVIGISSSRIIALFFIVFTIVLLATVQRLMLNYGLYTVFAYVTFAVQLPLLLLIKTMWNAYERMEFTQASKLSKLIIVAGVFSMLVFRYAS